METIYKKDYRLKLLILISIVAIAPMGFDGFIQLLTSYESNAAMRLFTGIPFGLFVGIFLAASFAARPIYFGNRPEGVILPSNTKFQLPDKESE